MVPFSGDRSLNAWSLCSRVNRFSPCTHAMESSCACRYLRQIAQKVRRVATESFWGGGTALMFVDLCEGNRAADAGKNRVTCLQLRLR